MTVELKLTATSRKDAGKGASRRLRRAKKLPAVLYGGGEDAVSLELSAQEIDRLLNVEAFFSQILTVEVDGKAQQAILKDMQRHPFKPLITHIDLQRVKANTKMRTHIPLHFIGEEAVIKREGGMILRDLIEVEIECLPKDLPQHIEVDVSELKLGESLHLSSLKLPAGVTVPALELGADHDISVVTLAASRVSAADEGEAGEEEG